MSQFTSVRTGELGGVQQGDYLVFSGGSMGKVRVSRVTPTTLTTRKVADRRWLEAVTAKIEDWLLYPAANLLYQIRVMWRSR